MHRDEEHDESWDAAMSRMIAERAKHKARARAYDEARVAAGEISAAELQNQNLAYRELRQDRISFIPVGKAKGRRRFLAP